ncbi:MAG TPA: hypothetical protein PK313_10090 [Myxococcota bacterium]|jgi:hypothetical protein|nr:hypothetical protein [Myxococcota bacterium]
MTKPLTIAVLVAVSTSLCTTAQAKETSRTRRFELGVTGGPVFAWSPEDVPVGGGGSLDFRASWPFGRVVRVGFRLGMLGAAIPHGEDADFEGPGEGSVMAASFLPTLRLLLAFDVTPGIAIEGGFGLGFFVSTRIYDGPRTPIPRPQAGIGATFRLWQGPKADLLLRVQVDLDDYDPEDGIAFIVPMAGLSASF